MLISGASSVQAVFSVIIFILLCGGNGFKNFFDTKSESPALFNGIFTTLSFLLGAGTSILSGFLGMRIATFANARTALEAKKGISHGFMCGK